MKLNYATKKEAQDRANKIHADLKATNPDYAKSCALYDPAHPEKGGTARWDFAGQEKDAAGNVTNAGWLVSVDDRAKPVMTAQEKVMATAYSEK